MTQAFQLRRLRDICPATGEDLGGLLSNMATAKEAEYRAGPGQVQYWGRTLAQVLYLAAEAYEQGSSASIGHKRSDRYIQAANELRVRAIALEDEAQRQSDDKESEALLACFTAGYNGEEGRNYSFDRREAFLIGQAFRAGDLQPPARMNTQYNPERGILVDGRLFTVEYPEGKIPDAIVHFPAEQESQPA